MSHKRRRSLLALLFLLIILGVILAVLFAPGSRRLFAKEQLLLLTRRAGAWAPVILIGIMALAVVVSPLPNVPIAAVLGMAYGPWWGTAIAVTGGLLGAVAAFEIARHVGRQVAESMAGRKVRFCGDCKESTLCTVVFVARLIPVVSFDVVSYGAGLSHMSLWRFVVFSLLGMLPWTWFYTAFGAAVLEEPATAALAGVLLGAAIFSLPPLVRRYNPWGLRDVMMERDEEATQ